MLLCRGKGRECSEVPALAGLGIFLARIEAIFTRFQFANHAEKMPAVLLVVGGFLAKRLKIRVGN